MKNIFDQPVIALNSKIYFALIIFLAPLINFLAGITVDLYSPSLPTIASAFNASMATTKNTITITLFGWMIGALFFGIMIDYHGRKKSLIFSLTLYAIASFWALFCTNIETLLVIRFIQGFAIAALSIGSRALIIDNYTGTRYTLAVLYTNIAYGLGPILGPFFGSLLQHHYGWRSNFMALFIISIVTLLALVFLVKESLPKKQLIVLRPILNNFKLIVSHKHFMIGATLLGLLTTQLFLYPTIGPFIVEKTLHYDVLVYGNTALVVGAFYLSGTLVTRLLIHRINGQKICYIGFATLLLALAVSYLVTFFSSLSLMTMVIPIALSTFSIGLIIPNILAINIKTFPDHAGLSIAVQLCTVFIVSSLSIYLVSHAPITHLWHLSLIHTVIILLETALFFGLYQYVFTSSH